MVSVKTKRQERAEFLLELIRGNLTNTTRCGLNIGKALLEISKSKFHNLWGYESFPEWIQSSGLDIKVARARYLMKIANVLGTTGVSAERVEHLGMEKLRTICTLNPQTREKDILDLFSKGKDMTLGEIRKRVGLYDYITGGPTPWLTLTFGKTQRSVVEKAAALMIKKNPELNTNRAIFEICKQYLEAQG